MEPGRDPRLEELFDAALALAPEERAAFVERSCAGDEALRAELLSLLVADSAAGSFLETPALPPPLPHAAEIGFAAGRRIGAYTIVRPIASGGMGSVYEALQDQPRRTVALKVMRAGLLSPSVLRRFQYEAELLGRLAHPSIARVYEAGTCTEGAAVLPYFAMELVQGASAIDEHAAAQGLSVRERLELFARVCDAVHHGHQRGVIHRDLKPANILVDAAGEPKIIDFGVARATDADLAATSVQTGVGQLLGTLQYMSPEQCEADPGEIDTRSDVYALGLVLYELLCGRRPYDLAGLPISQAVRIIRERSPLRPSTLVRALKGDLETIVLAALEKDRERRFASAAELASDVRRFLDGRPIEARRDSTWYVLAKTIERHKLPAAALAGFVVVVTAALIVSLRALDEAEVQRGQAEDAKQAVVTSLEEAQRAKEDAEGEARKYKATAEVLRDVFRSVRPGVAQGRDTTLLREVLDDAARRADASLAGEPEARADLLLTIGTTYRTLGLTDRAEAAIASALEGYRETLGEDHDLTAVALNELGHVRLEQYRLAETEALVRQALAIVERNEAAGLARPPEALSRTLLLGNLAALYGEMGKLDEAETWTRETLETYRRTLGPDSFDALRTAQNLAGVLAARGEWSEAEATLREALEASRRSQGERATVTSMLRGGLVLPLVKRGELAEAEALARENADLTRQVCGAEHDDTLAAESLVALVLESADRWEEAEPIRRRGAEAARRVLPAAHKLRGELLRRFGKCLTKVGSYEESERILEEARGTLEAAAGAESREARFALEDLYLLYVAWGKTEQAAACRTQLTGESAARAGPD